MTNKIQRTSGKETRPITIGKTKCPDCETGCDACEDTGEIPKTYQMSPLLFGVYGEMESYVCNLRNDPIDIASQKCDGLPAAKQQMLWDAAIRAATFAKIVPAIEMANFEKSVTGLAFKLWKSLEPKHPEIDSVKKATDLLIIAGAGRLAEVKAKLTVATGELDLKK